MAVVIRCDGCGAVISGPRRYQLQVVLEDPDFGGRAEPLWTVTCDLCTDCRAGLSASTVRRGLRTAIQMTSEIEEGV